MRYGAFVAVLAMSLPIPSGASQIDDEVAELRRQVALLTTRLDELERAEPSIPREDVLLAIPKAPGSSERIRIKGDFRYRHDFIDVEGVSKRKSPLILIRSLVS